MYSCISYHLIPTAFFIIVRIVRIVASGHFKWLLEFSYFSFVVSMVNHNSVNQDNASEGSLLEDPQTGVVHIDVGKEFNIK